MSTQRLIDSDERTRTKPMRILVLGMCRTETTSIAVALRKLGYTSYQMRNVLANPSELALWEEAVTVTLLPPQDRPSNQRNMEPYGKEEFDKLLADYDVVMDLPGCIFASQLVEAYPDAKVILTNRKYKDWEQSMQESIWCLDTWRLFTLCRQFNITQLAPLMRLVHTVFRVHNHNNYGGPAAKTAYDRHYDTVRSLVSQHRLLELDTDVDLRWEPLCQFLGKEAPKESFPKMSEEKTMRKGLESAWWGMVQYLVLLIILPGGVALGSFLLFTYADDFRAYRDGWLKVAKNYMETGEL